MQASTIYNLAFISIIKFIHKTNEINYLQLKAKYFFQLLFYCFHKNEKNYDKYIIINI